MRAKGVSWAGPSRKGHPMKGRPYCTQETHGRFRERLFEVQGFLTQDNGMILHPD